ncbi:hypothetical protein CA54_53850 [Symmachiella macrocystis]|uniref:Ice-binding protein C-terminal domain-containing protein n=1 Tax=Symmachiella macrocystis TaxID=2527985 RepID=A0A5C6B650_9PLAN|nr:PEP-CTERM sorting domain-containing protein [Symmachiella macrocystis]TWU06981.1 hypothetical protein CA54_53850 [Symmachiella macrocystis]
MKRMKRNIYRNLLLVSVSISTLLGSAKVANAELMIDVTGLGGDGFTTWTFSGTSIASSSESIPTGTNNIPGFSDVGQLSSDGTTSGLHVILDDGIQNQLFPVLSGLATVTVGADTQSITHVILDADSGTNPDDIGIRVDSLLSYLAGETSSWTGSIVVGVDLNDLRTGSFTNVGSAPLFSSGQGELKMNVNTPVPEPSTYAGLLGITGVSLLAYGWRRKRQHAV